MKPAYARSAPSGTSRENQTLSESARIYVRHAMAPATHSAYQAAWRQWARWAQDRRLKPLPATAADVANYLAEMADRGRAAASLEIYRSAVRAAHQTAGLDDPTAKEEVQATLNGIRRRAVAEGRLPTQATPLCGHHHVKIMAALSRDHGLRAIRDRALLWLMRDGMLRRSELCNLQLRDFQIEADCSGRLTIRRSKTDQQGAGCILYLSDGAARCVEDWIVRSEIYQDGSSAPLIRKVNRGGRAGRRALHPNSVSRVLKRLAELAGIDAARVSGHSCRIGMAIDLARVGTSLVAMQQAGRWKSPNMPARYIRTVSAGEGAVARYYERTGNSR